MYRNGKKNFPVPDNGCLIILSQLWHVHSISPPHLLVGQPSVSNFEKGGSEKNKCLRGVLKSPCHRYLSAAAYCASCQKRLYKVKNGF